jgi:hypothetical protein
VAKVKEPFNPFYALLLVAGILFSVSACAYGVMAFTAVKKGPIVAGPSSGQRLLAFLDDHGGKLLAGELAVLAIATVGVMFWDQRAASRAESAQLAAMEAAEARTKDSTGESP